MLLEDAVINSVRAKPNRLMKMYMCAGGHSDVSHPTTIKKMQEYRRKKTKQLATGSPASALMIVKKNESKSPTKSPTKKKRCRRRNSVIFNIDTTPGRDGEQDSDEPECADPRILFASYSADKVERHQSSDDDKVSLASSRRSSVLSPSSASSRPRTTSCVSTPASSIWNLSGLTEKNAQLTHRVAELDMINQDLIRRVASLTAEIEQLKVDRDQHAPVIGCYDGDDEGMCPPEQDSAKRKNRVQVENAKIARELSAMIDGFVTSPGLADRRKFPTRRLAKIIVDSILSFEWMHSEVVKVSSRQDPYADGRDADVWANLSRLLDVNLTRRGDKGKAAILVDLMWDKHFLDGEVQRCMIERVRCYLRNYVFTPYKILKAMDLAGFNLNLAGIEVLRQVDVEGKYERGVIPSKSTILRAARKVEAAAEAYCPFTMIGRTFQGPDDTNHDENDDNDIGEGFEFDAVKLTKTLFEAFGLLSVAKQRPVELGLASDGAQLTNTISHVAAGLKFNDMAICDPITKCPLLLHEPDSLVQSRNLCFPVRIVIAKDSKKTLDGFRALYNQFNSGQVAMALQCQSFKMSYPGDMKLQWGALDDGGAAKVKEKFCYICPCRSSTLHVPQDKTRCPLCKMKAPNDNEECYHYPFLADPEVRGELADELHALNSLVQDVIDADDNLEHQQPNSRQKMYVRHPGEVMIENDVFDIDYQARDANDKAIWARHITDELGRRCMPLAGTLFDRQQRLRRQLVNEQRSRDITRMLVESQPKDRAMYLVLQAVVCILHLENRVGLKSIESVLRSGLSNARKGVLEWTLATSVNRRQDEFVNRITSIINTQILGTVMAPSQWRFPLTEEGNMGTLSMDNNRTRLVMNSIELIVEESFANSDPSKRLLLSCFPRYREAINILRKSTDASDEEIATFQENIDAWFRYWVTVYGKEGCTNYTHMLSSSHVMRYMQEWRCLHRFSQQGWEALNALIKAYFFRRTNRGGLSKNSEKKSKLLGIARWLQRRIMWYSGHGNSLFIDDDDDSSFDNSDEDDDSVLSTDLDDTFESEHSSADDSN